MFGPCRLEKLVGRGGMGRIYKALHVELDRPVAVKLVDESIAAQRELAEVRAQVIAEARSAAKLDDPRIVAVYDVGEAHGIPFIIMQWVDGQSLEARVLSKGALPLEEALVLIKDTVCALIVAHEAGIVHRDIKPGNILIDVKGSVKLTDFGLARPAGQVQGEGEALAGSFHFMAPEQAMGAPSDPRSDLYALGGTWYYALTGRPPFPGPAVDALLRHREEPPPDVRLLRHEVTEKASALLRRLMAKLPADRPSDARTLLSELSSVGMLLNTDISGSPFKILPPPPRQESRPIETLAPPPTQSLPAKPEPPAPAARTPPHPPSPARSLPPATPAPPLTALRRDPPPAPAARVPPPSLFPSLTPENPKGTGAESVSTGAPPPFSQDRQELGSQGAFLALLGLFGLIAFGWQWRRAGHEDWAAGACLFGAMPAVLCLGARGTITRKILSLLSALAALLCWGVFVRSELAPDGPALEAMICAGLGVCSLFGSLFLGQWGLDKSEAGWARLLGLFAGACLFTSALTWTVPETQSWSAQLAQRCAVWWTTFHESAGPWRWLGSLGVFFAMGAATNLNSPKSDEPKDRTLNWNR